MFSQTELQQLLEAEELETVGAAFGGTAPRLRTSYSVPTIRDWVIAGWPYEGASPIAMALSRGHNMFSKEEFSAIIASLVRFSFLIELTNLSVGSTKMKTRWLPGKIKMPQPDSFAPIDGTFEPGNDPRSATFEECVQVFTRACNIVCDQVDQEFSLRVVLKDLRANSRVPYEFPLGYMDHGQTPVHTPSNIKWLVNDDFKWLLKARRILRSAAGASREAIRAIETSKIEVKLFKTDRALTGKDKTNRAKRWEVLAGDFQHSSLEECWSAERKLTTGLVNFTGFPATLRGEFARQGLIELDAAATLCPVTLEPLNFDDLAQAVLNTTIGISQYQIGHLLPLKRDGRHDGDNICWQSANGNRIQGDLSMEETYQLLDEIAVRRAGAS